LAAAARQKALNQWKARPAPDAQAVADRIEAQVARERVAAEKLLAKRVAMENVKNSKLLAVSQSSNSADQPADPKRSEAERKADRDARYAARKMRNM
jgi:hypothetical protein